MPSILCPFCQAPLTTTATLPPEMTVRCPKCAKSFAASTAAPEVLSLDESIARPPVPPPPPLPRTTRPAPPELRTRASDDDYDRRRRPARNNTLLFALIGGGVLVVGLIVGLIVYYARKKDDKKEETAGSGVNDMLVYFPADTVEVTFYNVEALAKVRQFKERFVERIQRDHVFAFVRKSGVDIDGLERVALCRAERSEIWIFVSRKPWGKAAIVKGGTEKAIKERKYHLVGSEQLTPSASVYFPTDTMMIVAPIEEFMTTMLDREPGKIVARAEVQDLVRQGSGWSFFRAEARPGAASLPGINDAPRDVRDVGERVKGRVLCIRVSDGTLERNDCQGCASADDAAKLNSFYKRMIDEINKRPKKNKINDHLPADQQEALRKKDESFEARTSGNFFIFYDRLDIKPFANEANVPLLPN